MVMQEFNIMKKFKNSANVVRAFEYDDGALVKGPPIIFMEAMGDDLHERIPNWKKVTYLQHTPYVLDSFE
jgi:hypothetical protein